MGSCRARSVYLTTRILGRLSPLSGILAHILLPKLTTALLESAEGNDYKILQGQSPWKNAAGPGADRTCALIIPQKTYTVGTH